MTRLMWVWKCPKLTPKKTCEGKIPSPLLPPPLLSKNSVGRVVWKKKNERSSHREIGIDQVNERSERSLLLNDLNKGRNETSLRKSRRSEGLPI